MTVEIAQIESLIGELASRDGTVRQRARAELVQIGVPAIGALNEAAVSRDSQLRWEAVKALAQIADSG